MRTHPSFVALPLLIGCAHTLHVPQPPSAGPGAALPPLPAASIELPLRADIRGTLDQIKKDKVKFEVRKVPARPLQQVFIHDPDGVMIELNFWDEEDVAELEGFDPMTNKAGARKEKALPAE